MKYTRYCGRFLAGRLSTAALLLLWIPGPPAAAIDYEPAPLDRMIGMADLIVYGKILRADKDTLTVHVEESLGESVSGDRLKIQRYQLFGGTQCVPDYEPGDGFIWLLSWRRQPAIVGSQPAWHVFGSEGEGEFPVVANRVLLPASLLAGFPTEVRKLRGCEKRVHPMERAVFWAAAQGYRRCFRWTAGKAGSPPAVRRICSEEQLQQYQAGSPMQRYLAR